MCNEFFQHLAQKFDELSINSSNNFFDKR